MKCCIPIKSMFLNSSENLICSKKIAFLEKHEKGTIVEYQPEIPHSEYN